MPRRCRASAQQRAPRRCAQRIDNAHEGDAAERAAVRATLSQEAVDLILLLSALCHARLYAMIMPRRDAAAAYAKDARCY